MKEKFEDRRLKGPIKVACKFDDGSVVYWEADKEETIEQIVNIVEDYDRQGYVLTLRQLHYQLVTENLIVNHESAYKKLSTILDDCRYSGIIDWDAIEDRGRIPYLPYAVDDVENALNDTVEQYRLDRMKGQDNYIELWTEKDALSGILKRVTSKYHIQLVVNKGYTSSSAMYRAYQRIVEALKRKQFTTILYFGDHDPSGLDMIRDIEDRLKLMCEQGEYELEFDSICEVVPIGLTREQITKYKLPPNPTKVTDPRAKWYVKKFGKICWEVDALKPQVLTKIVDDHISSRIDHTLYTKQLSNEVRDIAQLEKFIKLL